MASAVSASKSPVEDAHGARYELISHNDRERSGPPVLPDSWELLDTPAAPRIEVLVHDYPLWPPSLASGYVGTGQGEQLDSNFVLLDPKVEATAAPREGWVEVTADRLSELGELNADWDGHGGRAPEFEYISQAIEFLASVMRPITPPPSIVPTPDGGLQLEWHRAGLDVEILFSPEEDPVLYIHERATGDEREVPPVGGFLEFELGMRLAD